MPTLTIPFPNTTFGLTFSTLLLAMLAVVSWIDLKTLRIPKALTLGILTSGIVVSVVRGAWRGFQGEPVWLWSTTSAFPGGMEAFLFAICGVLVGFALFFGLWVGGVLGGGDVKLVAATGAWLGPWGILLAVFCSLPVFSVMGVGRIAYELSKGIMPSLAPRARPAKVDGKLVRNRISYSLSFTLGVELVLLYLQRHLLGITPPGS